MRRRFGRRRNSEEQSAREAAAMLTSVAASGVVAVEGLVPVEQQEIPLSLAAVGIGEEPGGAKVVIAMSPRSGAAAQLAGLAVGARLAAEHGFRGRVLAISPHWPQTSRALLGCCRAAPFTVSALTAPRGDAAAPESSEGSERQELPELEAEFPEIPALVTTPSASVSLPAGDDFWSRSAVVLQGLASKHGGVLQRDARGLRLVLLGEPVARLQSEEIELWSPRRETFSLASRSLDEAFDWLEGSIRKVLTNKKVLDGEMGLRSRCAPAFAAALGLDHWTRWPLGTGTTCPLDLLGVDAAGHPMAGALRRELALPDLLPILDAAALIAPRLPQLLPLGVAVPESTDPLPVAVAAETWSEPALRALSALAPALRGFQFRGQEPRAESFSAVELPAWDASGDAGRAGEAAEETAPLPPAATTASSGDRDAAGEARATGGGEEGAVRAPAPSPLPPRRFEELSLFDLANEDSGRGDAGGGDRGRRRRRRGGRGRSDPEERPRGSTTADAGGRDGTDAVPTESDSDPAPTPRRSRRGRRRSRGGPLMVAEVVQEDVEEEEPTATGPGNGEEGTAEPFAEAPGESDEEEVDLEALQTDADAALHGTAAATAEGEGDAEPASLQIAPRRRAAIAAHADRNSLGAAVLLARELRLIEGIWVYPQSDLMTFFRSVATDLREGIPIYAIGFTASPARETLQAAGLYRGRLIWFDHHDWPPEDLEGLRAAIGADAVHVQPGGESSVSIVASHCTRRSRFSDKLLDLLSSRFSVTDFERWGRYWWWRLGELAQNPGERRRDLQNLLAGRGSELAQREVQQPPPPLPEEVAFVAGRDFPLVHFGGYTLVSVCVPPHLDALFAARIARERYGAQLALARCEGREWVAVTGDDGSTRNALDLGALADHLAAKFDWLTRWPSHDYVVRVHVVDLPARPERLDEVIAEIAMGRSVLER